MSIKFEFQPSFIVALNSRIEELRNSITDLPKQSSRGYRFKNTDFVRKIVLSFVQAAKKADLNDFVIQQQIRGLNLQNIIGEYEEVMDGKLDTIILKSLTQAAEYDYAADRNVNVH